MHGKREHRLQVAHAVGVGRLVVAVRCNVVAALKTADEADVVEKSQEGLIHLGPVIGNTNLLNGWTEIGSAAMICEVVAGVARETPAAFGLAL